MENLHLKKEMSLYRTDWFETSLFDNGGVVQPFENTYFYVKPLLSISENDLRSFLMSIGFVRYSELSKKLLHYIFFAFNETIFGKQLREFYKIEFDHISLSCVDISILKKIGFKIDKKSTEFKQLESAYNSLNSDGRYGVLLAENIELDKIYLVDINNIVYELEHIEMLEAWCSEYSLQKFFINETLVVCKKPQEIFDRSIFAQYRERGKWEKADNFFG